MLWQNATENQLKKERLLLTDDISDLRPGPAKSITLAHKKGIVWQQDYGVKGSCSLYGKQEVERQE